jgi:hypothetical protein
MLPVTIPRISLITNNRITRNQPAVWCHYRPGHGRIHLRLDANPLYRFTTHDSLVGSGKRYGRVCCLLLDHLSDSLLLQRKFRQYRVNMAEIELGLVLVVYADINGRHYGSVRGTVQHHLGPPPDIARQARRGCLSRILSRLHQRIVLDHVHHRIRSFDRGYRSYFATSRSSTLAWTTQATGRDTRYTRQAHALVFASTFLVSEVPALIRWLKSVAGGSPVWLPWARF